MILRFRASLRLGINLRYAGFLSPMMSEGFHASSKQLHDKTFVNGCLVGAKNNKTLEVSNPVTDEVVTNVSANGKSDSEGTIQVANAAFLSWKNTTRKGRSQFLRTWSNLVITKQRNMAELLTTENRKPIKESMDDLVCNADNLEAIVEETKDQILLNSAYSKQISLIVGAGKFLNQCNLPLRLFSKHLPTANTTPTMSAIEFAPFGSSGVCNMLGSVRSVIRVSRLKGKRKTVKDVVKRFYRLYWGAWIRPKAGRQRKVWRKNNAMRKRALKHVFCNTTQSHMLDKMVCRFWREKKYYVNDPYESYHKRDNFYITRKLV